MRILNFGSLNIDHVYSVQRFAVPGETLPVSNYRTFAGGKGLNQSVALARAGAPVHHAGKVGADAELPLNTLRSAGVDVSRIKKSETPTGHGIIQVAASGENCILLFPGSNTQITSEEIAQALADFSAGDVLLVQNEINLVPEIISQAKLKNMKIAFNPAPMTPEVQNYPLLDVDYLFVNGLEAAMLTQEEAVKDIVASIAQSLPKTELILTLGEYGALYSGPAGRHSVEARKVTAVDTTAAGDTFIGYFLAELVQGAAVSKALEIATDASAICVTREGAAASIPLRREL